MSFLPLNVFAEEGQEAGETPEITENSTPAEGKQMATPYRRKAKKPRRKSRKPQLRKTRKIQPAKKRNNQPAEIRKLHRQKTKKKM